VSAPLGRGPVGARRGWAFAVVLSLLAHLGAVASLSRLPQPSPTEGPQAEIEIDIMETPAPDKLVRRLSAGNEPGSESSPPSASRSVERLSAPPVIGGKRRPGTRHPTPTPTPVPELPAPATPAAPPVQAAAPRPEESTSPALTVGDTDNAKRGNPEEVLGGAHGLAAGSAKAAFFELVKARVKAAWSPLDVYRAIDPEGRLEGRDLHTVSSVRMRADGSVERASVAESSGVAVLDGEAVAAMKRARLPPVLPELVDKAGGLSFKFGFTLLTGAYRYVGQLQRAITATWKPSSAFRSSGDKDRATVVRLLLRKDGLVIHTKVLSSAGLDFLDAEALAAAKPGTQLPAPPEALGRRPGLVPVEIEFLHRVHGASGLHVVRLLEIRPESREPR
jgi:TonB family protein